MQNSPRSELQLGYRRAVLVVILLTFALNVKNISGIKCRVCMAENALGQSFLTH